MHFLETHAAFGEAELTFWQARDEQHWKEIGLDIW